MGGSDGWMERRIRRQEEKERWEEDKMKRMKEEGGKQWRRRVHNGAQ